MDTKEQYKSFYDGQRALRSLSDSIKKANAPRDIRITRNNEYCDWSVTAMVEGVKRRVRLFRDDDLNHAIAVLVSQGVSENQIKIG